MKKILICLFTLVFVTSCVDDLDEYNIDTKRASNAPPATLFTSALLNLTDVLTTPNVNTNNIRLYVQHWATTQYVEEPRYNMTGRLIPQNFWNALYRDVLADLNESKRLLLSDATIDPTLRDNQLAQIEIMEVYTWSVLVTTFGDVPYTEALDPANTQPVYDDAQTIYNDILNRLDTALGLIKTEETGFGAGDVLYGGDMTQWIKFGNSLKLRLAMVIADVDEPKARTLVGEAAPNVFTSNADNAVFPYASATPNNNPISDNVNPSLTSREDFIAASTLVDLMNELNDPRRPQYFTDVDGEFIGGRVGFSNDYAENSTVSDKIAATDFPGLLLDYAEVEFLLAEAAERGFIADPAEEHYNAAVTASILYWGGTDAEARDYLAQPEVAYATASGDWRQKIGRQAWIAFYNRGYEAWLTWRRLDAPTLIPPVDGLTVPTRLIYPVNEQTLNPNNRAAAATAIGGDESSTKLFWDVR
ncbi:SusD/RagB family nutrient-binding outer membrane lipoprotein [uncultured Pontibacter sp.]|uniref:SusD/RagB family nutrient-binding outer membrane lipoprotein n=1 Tax=uncultured Pontibacter sp. TaxID=453356 RepID=UPI0026221BAC|nr:SusD/RagB family nutrient-binding outer membrane lipoprotein [uncultured Pontibacter sp.]